MIIAFIFYSLPVRAGIFSGLLEFISGKNQTKDPDYVNLPAFISFPLLGSKISLKDAIGGPDTPDTKDSPILVNLDGTALIASHNPTGALPVADFGQIFIYTVRKGDNPSSIAENFGITLNTLLWANNIRNPDLIRVGDKLIILPVSGVKYEVKKGDTIESIAKKFKGDPIEILSYNNLAVGEKLKVGSTLIIPNGELAPIVKPTRLTSASRLPVYAGYYMRPVVGGRKSQGLHGFNAVDLAKYCGASVFSSAAGRVIIARYSGWNGGYGKYVVISHPNNTQTLYAHLGSVLVTAGQSVWRGMRIGKVGSTGNSTGCHVHFEIRGARNPF